MKINYEPDGGNARGKTRSDNFGNCKVSAGLF